MKKVGKNGAGRMESVGKVGSIMGEGWERTVIEGWKVSHGPYFHLWFRLVFASLLYTDSLEPSNLN